jgi:hypothetical protein
MPRWSQGEYGSVPPVETEPGSEGAVEEAVVELAVAIALEIRADAGDGVEPAGDRQPVAALRAEHDADARFLHVAVGEREIETVETYGAAVGALVEIGRRRERDPGREIPEAAAVDCRDIAAGHRREIGIGGVGAEKLLEMVAGGLVLLGGIEGVRKLQADALELGIVGEQAAEDGDRLAVPAAQLGHHAQIELAQQLFLFARSVEPLDQTLCRIDLLHAQQLLDDDDAVLVRDALPVCLDLGQGYEAGRSSLRSALGGLSHLPCRLLGDRSIVTGPCGRSQRQHEHACAAHARIAPAFPHDAGRGAHAARPEHYCFLAPNVAVRTELACVPPFQGTWPSRRTAPAVSAALAP